MKNFIKCKICLAMAEHRLLGMDLCEYHFVRLSNDVFSKNGIEVISDCMRWLHA